MKYEGWTYGDLAGELWARGIDIDEVDISGMLDCPRPEMAARLISQGRTYTRTLCPDEDAPPAEKEEK